MNFFNYKYFRIFILLGASYLISNFSINNLFIANSPKINTNAGSEMMAKVNNYWLKTTSMLAYKFVLPSFTTGNNNINNNLSGSTNNNLAKNNYSNSFNNNRFQPKSTIPSDIQEALTTTLSKVSSGVYAGEKNNIKVYEVRTNEIEYLEYTFNVKGKEIKIKVPKDQTKPTQAEMDAIFQ